MSSQVAGAPRRRSTSSRRLRISPSQHAPSPRPWAARSRFWRHAPTPWQSLSRW